MPAPEHARDRKVTDECGSLQSVDGGSDIVAGELPSAPGMKISHFQVNIGLIIGCDRQPSSVTSRFSGPGSGAGNDVYRSVTTQSKVATGAVLITRNVVNIEMQRKAQNR